MANANVEALKSVLEIIAEDQPWLGSDHEVLAEALAARGVLVVSPEVLTDEAISAIVPLGKSGEWESGDQVRAYLSGIARGSE